jgi:hypothetical protein
MTSRHDTLPTLAPRSYTLKARVYEHPGVRDEAAFLDSLQQAVRTALRNVPGVESVELEVLPVTSASGSTNALSTRRPLGELGVVREV